MRNFTGYFFAASKFGGLTRKPSTLSPLAPVNQKDSSEDMAICERTASLKCVSCSALGRAHFAASPVSSHGPSIDGAEYISTGLPIDIRVNSRRFSSGVTDTSSLKPRISWLIFTFLLRTIRSSPTVPASISSETLIEKISLLPSLSTTRNRREKCAAQANVPAQTSKRSVRLCLLPVLRS